jgi:hypothetical protein
MMMKDTIKLFGIIVIMAIIGFSMTACDDGFTNGGNNNNPGDNNKGSTLPAPKGLTVKQTSRKMMSLSWSEVPGAKGYVTYSSLSVDGVYLPHGGGPHVASSKITKTQLLDDYDWNAGTIRYYKVAAIEEAETVSTGLSGDYEYLVTNIIKMGTMSQPVPVLLSSDFPNMY